MIGCSASEGGDWNEHRALISAFAARHPNIRVSVVQPTSTVFEEALAQVSPALKAGRDALAFAAEERDPDLRAHMMALAVELNALAFEPQASSDGV
jgi:ABC-type glycerol-3-phosphate transport system substrate-binding protein